MPDPIVTATPDTLTLAPGESAQVTVAVDPDSSSGLVGVSIAVEVPPQYDYLIEGDIGPLTIAQGETGHVVGDFSLLGDLIIEGVLTGIDTFTCEGNGFQILVQHGGRLDLAGKPKSGWVDWDHPDDQPVGWEVGDRLAVAPIAYGKTALLPFTTWTGDWATMFRHADAHSPTDDPAYPNLTIIDGSVQRPEVANLVRSINFRHLRRLHFHDKPGVQSLRHLAIIDSGTSGVLGDYPCHFHLCGDWVRGSLLEGVVVENGKNHAMVPHGSHEITMRDFVAYNTIGDVYWWDPPVVKEDPADPNNSNDLLFDHCLSLGNSEPSAPPRLTGFFIGAGTNNAWRGNVAACVAGTTATGGGKESSGFRWTEHFVAVFKRNKAHNCRRDGIFTWTNNVALHVIDDFIAYHIMRAGIEHGAYTNNFTYRNVVIHIGVPVATGTDATYAVLEHAISGVAGGLLFENIVSDDRLLVSKHSKPPTAPTRHRNCTYTGVLYQESIDQPSIEYYEDCGLVPAQFNMASARPTSVAEIYEDGLLTHRWTAGAWS